MNAGIKSHRFALVDFTRPLYQSEERYWTTFPKPLPPYQNLFLVFTWKLWAATIATIMGMIVVLFTIRPIGSDRIHLGDKNHNKVKTFTQNLEYISIYICSMFSNLQ